jgi:hypothetical protein
VGAGAELRARLDGLERALAAEAARAPFEIAPASAEHTGFLVAGDPVSFPIDVGPERCATVVTAASGGLRDLDASLFDGSGALLAEDIEPDAHPTLQLCARGAPRRAYVLLRAYAGAGAYVARVLPSRRAALPVIRAAVGGRPGIAPDEGPERAASAALRAVERAGLARGFDPVAEAFDVAIDARRETWVPVEVPPGRCVSVAVAEEDADDATGNASDARAATPPLSPRPSTTPPSSSPPQAAARQAMPLQAGLASVAWVDDAGVPRARATPFEGALLVQDCPERAGRHALVLGAERPVRLRVAVQLGEAARVGGRAGLFAGERAADDRARAALADAIAAAARDASAQGFGRAVARVEGTLAAGEVRRLSVPLRLQAGVCARLVAVPGPGHATLTLAVHDPLGRPPAARESPTGGAAATAHLCGTPGARASGSVTVDVGARRGQGAFALIVFAGRPRAEAGRAGAGRTGATGVDPAVLDFVADGVALGFPPAAASARARGAPGESLSLDALPTARCARIGVRSARGPGVPGAMAVRGACRWPGEPAARIALPDEVTATAERGGAPPVEVFVQDRPLPPQAGRACPGQDCAGIGAATAASAATPGVAARPGEVQPATAPP